MPKDMIRRALLFISLACSAIIISAQSDPIVMRVNGKPVTRSEFEYNYNKNNTDGVIDQKTVEEYAELYANYRLKVEAALDAHLDTLSSYQQEFRSYRDQQIRPLLVTDADVEQKVRDYYAQMVASLEGHELMQPAHIFIRLPQQATADQQTVARERTDSIYAAFLAGADFAQLAAQHSDDRQTAANGGVIGWVGPHQLLKEIEDVMYSLKKGEVAKPLLSTVGWHIIKLNDQKSLEPFDTLAPRIQQFLESRGIREQLATQLVDSIAAASDGQKTAEQVLDEEADRLAADDTDLRYLIQEYHDGLLLFEICQRQVWTPASQDTVALEKYFKKNKKKYAFDKPHYAGALLQARTPDVLKRVQKALKGQPEDEWANIVRRQFNADSVMVRFERRVFEQGENTMVDSLAFGIKAGKTKLNPQYPCVNVIGRKMKKGPKYWTDVRDAVVADYQALKEQEFVAELRRRYTVEIYQDALDTVNRH